MQRSRRALSEPCGVVSIDQFADEYKGAGKDEKDDTTLGRFILAALAQKSMVTNRIFASKNLLAGYSIDFNEKGFKGIRDYKRLVSNGGKEDETDDKN